MTKKNKEKGFYLVPPAVKKAPLINLYSLPTKCPVCHSFQEPEQIAVQETDNDAIVKFCCTNKSCKSSFSALYLKGSYGKQEYHFICFGNLLLNRG
ncbi:hypothetical protein Q75_09750 [Bacillus coahuilensis p1.1.43]|uniref:Uncharacterized protein n=1 Tax=Bacillus coahuilensis p1.1.43 TaxID=1150625 RepID=A0A147K7T1_9BACI|nr:hypothetical protein [Bacillus coahuilensis]KUP06201.1 hypothetical protein Q75_09750 [Bacillus coahuilensis p1.1.43]